MTATVHATRVACTASHLGDWVELTGLWLGGEAGEPAARLADDGLQIGVGGARLFPPKLRLLPIKGDDVAITATDLPGHTTTTAGPAGKMDVAVIEDEGRDEEGNLVFKARRTLVVRASKES